MQINIIGYGVMGSQISSLFMLMNYELCIFSRREISSEQVLKNVKKVARMLGVSYDETKLKFSLTNLLEDLPKDSISLECVSENLSLKRQIYEQVYSKNSLFLSNTSSFKPSDIKENVVGFHFFNPISLRLIELFIPPILSENTSLKTIIKDLQSLNFSIIDVKDNKGYLANFILFNEISTIFKLIEKQGYKIEQIIQIYNKLYNGRDIFELIDIISLDTTYQILQSLNEQDSSIYVPNLLKNAIDNGFLGKKNKKSIKLFLRQINEN